MHILFTAISTAIFIVWIVLFIGADSKDAARIIIEKIDINNQEINKRKQKILDMRHKINSADKIKKICLGILYSEKSEIRKTHNLIKSNEKLKTNKIKIIDILPLAGYRLLSLIGVDSTNPSYKKIVEHNAILSGRNNAMEKTQYQLASSLAYLIIDVGICFCIATLLIIIGKQKQGLLAAMIGTLIVGIMVYLPFDELKGKIEKRDDEIIREFPQAVSKLSLLVGAGIDMTQAWEQTARSKPGILYEEMSVVIDEMHNGISPYNAYNDFIHRCNNKYTSKLGTSIMQNLTKGNEEICVLLNQITSESWSERRQYAKRKGEIAQSKLLFPIMLMFAGVILLVMAPVMASFMNMGA